jgi:hypothetical protein
MNRRRFGARVLGLLPTYALLQHLLGRDLVSASVRPITRAWLRDLDEASRAVAERKLPPVVWQNKAEALLRRVPLQDLLRLVDFDRLARQMDRPDPAATAEKLRLPGVEGLPAPEAFVTKVFALPRGGAIVPHGHRNMVSMHVLLSGEVRLRHFDREGDEPGAMLLRPTIDRVARPGDLSSISDQRDNVHWFAATRDRSFTLDVIVDRLDPSLGYPYRIDFVDPDRATPAADGLLRVPIIPFAEAVTRYTRTS